MANRRGIKRGRIPFRGPKRPVRWAGTSVEPLGDGSVGAFPIGLAGTQEPPICDLIDGPNDVEPWSDANEITVDRVVGSISSFVNLAFTAEPANSFMLANPVIRYGILKTDGTTPDVDLFDQAQIEELQWLWLHQHTTDTARTGDVTAGAGSSGWSTFQVDTRCRRKIGRTDTLSLYATAGFLTGPLDSNIANLLITSIPLLRVVMLSR